MLLRLRVMNTLGGICSPMTITSPVLLIHSAPSKPTATNLPHRFTLTLPPPTPLYLNLKLSTPKSFANPPQNATFTQECSCNRPREWRKEGRKGMLHQHLLMRMMSTDELSVTDETLMQYVCGIWFRCSVYMCTSCGRRSWLEILHEARIDGMGMGMGMKWNEWSQWIRKDLTGEEKVKRNSMAAGRDHGRCFILCVEGTSPKA